MAFVGLIGGCLLVYLLLFGVCVMCFGVLGLNTPLWFCVRCYVLVSGFEVYDCA